MPHFTLLAHPSAVLARNQTDRGEIRCRADASVSQLSGLIGYVAAMTVKSSSRRTDRNPNPGATLAPDSSNGVIMYRTLFLAALAGMLAGPALAAGGTCSTAPKSQFKPKAALEAQLTGEGLTVRQIKVEKGCYEVYAVDKAGKKVNLAYNAETLEKLDNAEAGEN
ncbi:hypothetical protein DPM33_12065 [Mesorhizobium hawassense]|uniref:PepSY domain-containing protein n=2 Tax=Mesorhizobium hawassense TaxID=1209954 RepID=A0A330HQM5_9HYPH|nr:hypothetical protein DPM33_12065 [Mesorhizobium hawassense]